MTHNPYAIGLNAMANSSSQDVTTADLISILKTGTGPGNLVRALFEDCSFDALEHMAIAAGVSRKDLLTSYKTAKEKHHAANAEIDQAV